MRNTRDYLHWIDLRYTQNPRFLSSGTGKFFFVGRWSRVCRMFRNMSVLSPLNGCIDLPPPLLWQHQIFPDILKCPWGKGDKIAPAWEPPAKAHGMSHVLRCLQLSYKVRELNFFEKGPEWWRKKSRCGDKLPKPSATQMNLEEVLKDINQGVHP